MKLLLILGFAVLVGVTLGGGGSALLVPALHYGMQLPAKEAARTAQIVVGATSLFACLFYWRAGDVCFPIAAVYALIGLLGVLLGTQVSHAVSDNAVMGLLGVVLLGLGAWMLRSAGGDDPIVGDAVDQSRRGGRSDRSKATRSALTLLVGASAGFLTGLFGVGGGIFIVPALTTIAKLPMRKAVGTSLAVISVNCASASLRGHATPVDWTLALTITSVAVVISFIAARLVRRAPAAAHRRLFAVLTLIIAAMILVSSLREGFG